MEQLFQMSWPAVLALLLAPGIAMAQGSNYCSLSVKMVDSSGAEDSSPQLITVIEKNGRTISAENRAGGVSFCDLGILPVTVKVTKLSCNNVGLRFGTTTTLKILSYDGRCSTGDGNIDTPPAPWCTVLLRFKDEEDNWVSEVRLKPFPPAMDFRDADPHHRPNPYSQSDRAGRILVTIDPLASFRAIATRDGYKPETIDIPCTAADTYYTDRIVSLHRVSN